MADESIEYVRTPRAAARLGVTGQTIRNWLSSGDLRGRRTGRAWEVEVPSIEEALAVRRASSRDIHPGTSDAERQLRALESAVEELRRARESDATRIEALEQERDRYRADALAARAAALRSISSSEKLDESTRQLLDALKEQREALIQTLAPGSPADLLS
jgi:predicted transcriptional regulator